MSHKHNSRLFSCVFCSLPWPAARSQRWKVRQWGVFHVEREWRMECKYLNSRNNSLMSPSSSSFDERDRVSLIRTTCLPYVMQLIHQVCMCAQQALVPVSPRHGWTCCHGGSYYNRTEDGVKCCQTEWILLSMFNYLNITLLCNLTWRYQLNCNQYI